MGWRQARAFFYFGLNAVVLVRFAERSGSHARTFADLSAYKHLIDALLNGDVSRACSFIDLPQFVLSLCQMPLLPYFDKR